MRILICSSIRCRLERFNNSVFLCAPFNMLKSHKEVPGRKNSPDTNTCKVRNIVEEFSGLDEKSGSLGGNKKRNRFSPEQGF
ncbi:MAG: hypothetical protein ACFFCQ_18850 [Promethearchaeota archaeon]